MVMPALALDIHGIEHLFLHLPRRQPAAELDQPVGEGRFPVVDMGDDGKIADLGEVGHGGGVITAGSRCVQPDGAPAVTVTQKGRLGLLYRQAP